MKIKCFSPRGKDVRDEARKVILEAEDEMELRALAHLIYSVNPSDEICALYLEAIARGKLA